MSLLVTFWSPAVAQSPTNNLSTLHLAHVNSIQFVETPEPPELPDYADIKQLSDMRIALEKRLEAARALQAVKPPKTPPPVIQAPTQAPVVSQDTDKLFIYMHESGNLTWKINPYSGACGLGQALPCSKMGCSLQDYPCQDRYFTGYMLQRYGSWSNAVAFWQSHRWW